MTERRLDPRAWHRCLPGFAGRGTLAALIALLGLAAPKILSAQTPPDTLVAEVIFQGNESFEDRELGVSIVSRGRECAVWIWFCEDHFLSRRELPRDMARIQLFYVRRGFWEASVDTLVTPLDSSRVNLVFQISEGPPIRVDSMAFTGLDTLRIEGLTEKLPLRVGDPLSVLALDATRDTLTARLKNNGYAHAEVLRGWQIPADSLVATVFLDAYPGTSARFGPISVTGAPELGAEVVRRMLPFEQGDPYSQALLFQGQRNLFGLDLIRHANLNGDLSYSPDSIIPVQVDVAEGDVHTVRWGAGFGSAECLATQASWRSSNFQGGGRQLTLTGRLANILNPALQSTICNQAGTGKYSELNWLISAEFTQPYVLSSRNAISASVYAERATVPEIFIREAQGINLGWIRTVSARGILTTFYRPQRVRLDAAEVYFCSAFLICSSAEIDRLVSYNLLSPVGVNYQLDRTDQPLNPTKGSLLSLDFEVAGRATGSEYTYARVAGAASGYKQVAGSVVLAGRIRTGVLGGGTYDPFGDPVPDPYRADQRVEDIYHPEKRFFSGGANSVRGFAQNQLGPRNLSVGVESLIRSGCTAEEVNNGICDASALSDGAFDRPAPTGGTVVLEGNMEARVDVWGSWQAVFFVDAGQVWDLPALSREGQDWGFSNLFQDLEFTPGTGVRYVTPIGPLRVDIGYSLRSSSYLPVVTEKVGVDPTGERCDFEVDQTCYFRQDELVVLENPRLFPTSGGDELPLLSLRRFQLHFTIGQAF